MPARIDQAALERVLNHCLSLDPYVEATLQHLDGRLIEFVLADSGLSVFIRFLSAGIRVESVAGDVKPHARISGSIPGFIKMVTDLRQAKSVFGSSVSVTGDVEVIQNLRTLLIELDIDWEEQLARWVGDTAAHGIGRAARAARGWSRATSQVFWLDVGEYLTEETEILPRPDEVSAYLEGVDEIRDDVERLMVRVARLKVSASG